MKKLSWQMLEKFKGVPVYGRHPACKARGPRFLSGPSCHATLERAREYITQLEREGFLAIHQRET